MNRRYHMSTTAILLLLLAAGCHPTSSIAGKREGVEMKYEINKSEPEWKKQLTDEQFRVTRGGGTESAHSGEYCKTKEPGTYECICCRSLLFKSDEKYDSGSGWPSFWKPADPENLQHISDKSHGMVRTEIRCARCGAHLGHVFNDGPKPTGLRYCINSVALHFSPRPVQPQPKQDE